MLNVTNKVLKVIKYEEENENFNKIKTLQFTRNSLTNYKIKAIQNIPSSKSSSEKLLSLRGYIKSLHYLF